MRVRRVKPQRLQNGRINTDVNVTRVGIPWSALRAPCLPRSRPAGAVCGGLPSFKFFSEGWPAKNQSFGRLLTFEKSEKKRISDWRRTKIGWFSMVKGTKCTCYSRGRARIVRDEWKISFSRRANGSERITLSDRVFLSGAFSRGGEKGRDASIERGNKITRGPKERTRAETRERERKTTAAGKSGKRERAHRSPAAVLQGRRRTPTTPKPAERIMAAGKESPIFFAPPSLASARARPPPDSSAVKGDACGRAANRHAFLGRARVHHPRRLTLFVRETFLKASFAALLLSARRRASSNLATAVA